LRAEIIVVDNIKKAQEDGRLGGGVSTFQNLIIVKSDNMTIFNYYIGIQNAGPMKYVESQYSHWGESSGKSS